jgi:hypothetical protein
MACEEERLSGPGAAVNSVLKTGVNFMVTAHCSPVYILLLLLLLFAFLPSSLPDA